MSGIEMTMQVQGLDALLRHFGSHQTVIEAEARGAERAGLVVLRDEARSHARTISTDARFPNSITFETIQGGLAGIVGSVARTGLSIEEGRKKGETPSATLLAAWVGRRGLAPGERYSIKSHRRLRPTKAVRAAELELAWKIAIRIREHGTRPLPFLMPAARAKADQVRAIFHDAARRALQKVVRG